MKQAFWAAAVLLAAVPLPVYATQAYGSLNNFDVVNDTGEPCHGFEIEIEDIHARDITYTYDYNHYGTPRIEEDTTDPLHPIVRIRYESKKNPDGSWAAYTAVPDGPVAPTDGHQFTNPNVNFGGEHFGAGFYGVPAKVSYFWLLDDFAGGLRRGDPVNIATPAFSYVPRPNGGGQVNAVIEAPDPPEVHVKEFGEPIWVQVTRTQTHSNHKVELEDLVSDDPDDPNDRNWRNGEPDEVEVEWQLMQIEFSQDGGGKNGELENEPLELGDGDEVVTYRYDFYEYAGPLDPESGEAMTDNVGPDGIHGDGIKEDEEGNLIDFSQIVVVGDYIGAQMAGFDPAGQMGLIDNLQDGEINVPYVERTIVVAGTPPIVNTVTGDLPQGMDFDDIGGVLSGTPLESGIFAFTVNSVDSAGADVTQEYELTILGEGGEGAFEGEGAVEGIFEGEGAPEGVVEGVYEGEGSVEGTIEGVFEGEGSSEGVIEGAVEGEGSPEGSIEGSIEGEGSSEGSIEGSIEGEGSSEGSVEGSVEGAEDGEGSIEGSLDGEFEGEGSYEGIEDGEGDDEGEEGETEIEIECIEMLDGFGGFEGDDNLLSFQEAAALLPALTQDTFNLLDTNGDGVLNVAELLRGAGGNKVVHSGDVDGDKAVSLPELLRMIQLYNARAYACLELPGDSEDGYAPAAETAACNFPHAADYQGGADGTISLSELLRMIQFFSSGAYHYCAIDGTEDGFCPGSAL
ncbi:MAG: hypothetical protein GC168_16295 [Candidatus Hydrogenedens sp.]|nr:hypothetical protein [Candidatus Hydrogenedens sp.]